MYSIRNLYHALCALLTEIQQTSQTAVHLKTHLSENTQNILINTY